MYGKLRPGVTPESAQTDLGTIAARLARQFPDTNRNLVPVVRLYTETMGSDDENAVFFMVLIVGLGFGVLLVACANVSNLLLARAVARTRDIALRTALGAGRRRLVAGMLAETAVLALGGTVLGLLLAQAGIVWFNRSIVNLDPPFWVKVGLDGAALAFAAVLTAVSALLAGVIPAWRASRGDVSGLLKDGSRGGGMRLGRASRVLVASEIAVSFALLVLAGLMSRSIVNLGTHHYGFAMENVFTARVALPEQRYPDAGSRARFAASLADRVAALPGVRSVTLATSLPGLSADRTPVAIDGRVYQDASEYPVVRSAVIGPGYFETFDRPLVGGRDFTVADDEQAPRVAIVNASFAERHFPGGDPVGRRVRLGRDGSAPWATVVGIAPDLYMGGAEDRDRAGLYVPIAQGQARTLSIAVRVGRGAAQPDRSRTRADRCARPGSAALPARYPPRSGRCDALGLPGVRAAARGHRRGVALPRDGRPRQPDVVRDEAADGRDRTADGARRASVARGAAGRGTGDGGDRGWPGSGRSPGRGTGPGVARDALPRAARRPGDLRRHRRHAGPGGGRGGVAAGAPRDPRRPGGGAAHGVGARRPRRHAALEIPPEGDRGGETP